MSIFFRSPLLFICLCLAMACSSEKRSEETQETSRLVLKLSGATGAKLVIQELKDKSWLTVDSILDYKGDATFEIHNSEADYYRVMDTTSNMAIVILIPGKTATIEGDLKNVLETFKSSDSKENNQYYNFQRNLFAIRSHEEEWVKKYRTFMESPKTEDSATHYVTLLRDMQDESDAFVKSYIDSIMPSFTVYSLVNYLRIEKEFDYMFTLAERIRKEMPDSKYSRLFIGEISRMKAYKEEETKKDKAAIGTPAPNFTLNDRNGKSISLTSLKGKYVVIDFWASWCGPCRAESPNMVKLYKKMKSDRFEILGVSLDGSEDAWDKAIEKDGLNWLHVSDLMQWNSPVVALYGIEGIPATVVVDPNGIIVAKNLRGEELMTKLEELLK